MARSPVRYTPLVSLQDLPPPPRLGPVDDEPELTNGEPIKRKRWYHYLPLCLAILMIIGPHPSLFMVFINYHYRIHNSLSRVFVHVFVLYALTFLAFSSLIVVIARDPGPVTDKSQGESGGADDSGDEGESFLEALLAPSEGEAAHAPGRWCKKYHHCIWLGHKCIGHRTYASFIHFLCCATLLAAYAACLCSSVVWWSFNHSASIDEMTPVHAMFVAFYGIVITMVIGSFCVWHLYLASTNQTTVECLSPFLLLRELPPLTESPEVLRLSNPPLEHELSFEQRMIVRDAHRRVHIYDLGFRKNWAQVFGWSRPWGWVYRLLMGGGCVGDGKSFPRHPRAEQNLTRLASNLASADKNR
ncbi:zf-DHHC-domain-containing protein [Epithele typhae]|uniref:zf-DHHC-domain-containing protein n=1 Tax=Epithele typhae TaxID=378194 RepID=UPI002008D5D5|nr:zf-DHHC-domain-containing protein [Epithele typhae]KAH9929082.1 zf-DHHC-domain-containing protein [Epithele typhae]